MAKKEVYIENIKRLLKSKLKWSPVTNSEKNRLLRGILWDPDLLLRHSSKIIGLDINLEDVFPTEGAKEISKFMRRNKNFDFYFYVPQNYDFEQIFPYCFNHGFGIIQDSGREALVILKPRAKAEQKRVKIRPKRKRKIEFGHVPENLIKYLENLQHISFRRTLRNFCKKYRRLRKKYAISEQEYNLVENTVKKMFNNTNFIGSPQPYIKLRYYEHLLTGIREHFLHSFQIFLMGCIIIDKYYTEFSRYYKNVFPREKKFSLEYIWLLTSIFHDIGYPSQKAELLIGNMYGYADKVRIVGLGRIANTPEYRQAAEQIQSFIRHSCSSSIHNNWSPEIVTDEDSAIKDILIRNFVNRKLHSVTSSFQFLTKILKEAAAVSKRPYRPLIITHVMPAVVSIALHDCHIWTELKNHGVFPININRFPFAVLLIFLDSLHDWRREGSEDVPEFAEFLGFEFQTNSIEVKIMWTDPEKLAKKKAEYGSVKENVEFNGISLNISAIELTGQK